MYRDYEDPRALRQAIAAEYQNHERLSQANPVDLEALMESESRIHELEAREDAAWADEESDLYD